MLDRKSEQQINIKFFAKLKRFETTSFQLLTKPYDKDCMSRIRAFEPLHQINPVFVVRKCESESNERDFQRNCLELNCLERWGNHMRLRLNSKGNYFQHDPS